MNRLNDKDNLGNKLTVVEGTKSRIFINGIPIAAKGDKLGPLHNIVLVEGSSFVNVNGIPVAIQTNKTSIKTTLISGSNFVFVDS